MYSLVSGVSIRRCEIRFPASVLTLYVQVNRHFVAAVSVRGYAEVPRAVLSTRAYELEGADAAVGGVLLLQRVPIVGQFLLQVCAHLLPNYFQRVVALRLAAQRRARAKPRRLIPMFLHEMGRHCACHHREQSDFISFLLSFEHAWTKWDFPLFIRQCEINVFPTNEILLTSVKRKEKEKEKDKSLKKKETKKYSRP